MSWFRTFFEDDYLRVFGPYVDGERADREAAGVTRLLDLPAGSRVLDLACGQGRHAVPLRRAGLDVLGLDLSQVLLQAARDRDPHLPLLQADMRALPLADDAVDGVVNLFNAFGYFAREFDDLGVLREVARVLRPGGVFVQEVHHRDALVRDWEPRTTHPTYDDGLVVTENREWDSVQGRHRVTYLLQSPEGPTRRLEHTLRVYTLTELVTLHERAGLRVRDVHGDFEGGDVGLETPLGVITSTVN
jgi:SAM-dependent methyltransferase